MVTDTDKRQLAQAGRTTVLAFTVALMMGACESLPPPPPGSPIDQVVFITIDTLRADHLPSFGYPVNTAPFLDSLARKGVSFKKAFAQSATTGPSHASMFTSLYPLQHRVQNNSQKLDERFVTLAEILAARGYATAAFVSANALFGSSQIAQGFQDYDRPGKTSYSEGKQIIYRPANQTTDAVIRWIGSRRHDERRFLWVHYYDPHNPLRPPKPYLDEVDPSDWRELRRLADFLRREHRSNFSMRRLRRIIQYDAEIRFVDAQIERLFHAVQAQDPGSNTLWVVTSDHGQGLANHKRFGHHIHIYNEQLHVPLFFHFSNEAGAGHVVEDQLVELVELPVTILDLLGETLAGQVELVQGQSLVPLLYEDKGYRHKRFAFGERRRTFGSFAGRSEEPDERYSLQSLKSKYIWFSQGPDEFYDLIFDPYETQDLINQPVPGKDEMRETLRLMVGKLRSDEEAEAVDEETLKRLKALGYVR